MSMLLFIRAIKEQTLVQLSRPMPHVNINLQPPAQAALTVSKPIASRHVQTKEEYKMKLKLD